ncbi:5-oxoprolinase subunit B family protein [Nocardia sp. NPDC003482]
MTAPRILPAGDRALLLELPQRLTPAALTDRLRADALPGIADLLPAARTVLVTLAPDAVPAKVTDRLEHVLAEFAERDAVSPDPGAAPLEIPVRYDGDDLAETAALLGISADELITRHTDHLWQCAFIGFAPGFGYLTSPDADLTVPRRDRSRTKVPAGSVALAGGYSAVYPRSSPGGWRIIGRTDTVLWDLDRPEPAALRPGASVRFVRVEGGTG